MIPGRFTHERKLQARAEGSPPNIKNTLPSTISYNTSLPFSASSQPCKIMVSKSDTDTKNHEQVQGPKQLPWSTPNSIAIRKFHCAVLTQERRATLLVIPNDLADIYEEAN